MLLIKAVLFDGYGTLFAGGMERLHGLCQQICDDHRLDLDGKGFLHEWDQHFLPMLRGDAFMTFRVANNRSLKATFAQLEIEADQEPYVDHFFELLGEVSLYDEVRSTIEKLNGFPHGVVSNADSDHLQAALDRNELHFDLVVSSESAQAYKPNPDIFLPALEKLGVSASDALYVGDSQEDDLEGAHRAGTKMAWVNRDGSVLKEGIPAPDYEIEDLSEVLGILGV